MPNTGTKFEFLTMAEFNKLERKAKSEYLEKAVVAVVEESGGDFTEQSLFKDGPPAPPPISRKR